MRSINKIQQIYYKKIKQGPMVVVGDEEDGGRPVERSSSSGWRPELEEAGGRRLERTAAGGSRGGRRLAVGES
jgi:hypothetical protein